ncbi:MAG: ATP-binding cassette domain-containing protein [Clostridia bacterium]|nr:ATP-binding cassette domain-containing protein [Clostridia bacterium]
MSKLKLVSIRKTYKAGTTIVEALKNISLEFNESEFVSILGPSGCGKTTLLNLIGGLDRYDSGDLIINGVSTKNFKDSDWDAYRNKSIGFVFQNYNLITHQTVLQNVEIAMTLSGVKTAERRKRAKEALEAVGLDDQMKKKPNQLSGGQMQRVAIARALVNNPDIILADEPTGSLDSHTSIQIMDILKEISKTRLVIMVTHNKETADMYSSRIIHLLDGELHQDNNVNVRANGIIPSESEKFKRTSMSLFTATALSFRNLLTKKGRTIITSLAGSIGIIGVALVLALSGGLSSYIDKMQAETLSGFPISISTGEQRIDFTDRQRFGMDEEPSAFVKYPSGDTIYRYDSSANTTRHINVLSEDYLNYVSKLEHDLPGTVNTISYSRGVSINVLAKGEESVVRYGTSRNYWQEMPENTDFILSLYDLIGESSRLPVNKNEVILIVDEYNRIDEALFQRLGIFTQQETYQISDFIGKTILKVIPNNDFYHQDENGLFIPASSGDYETIYNSDKGFNLTITGILRLKDGAASSYLSPGIAYTTALTEYMVDNAKQSEIAKAQKEADYDVVLNIPFANDAAKQVKMISLGADTTPTGINIYPVDFNSKDSIKTYLEEYNTGKANEDQVVFTDLAETITSVIGTLLNTVTYVLIGFAAISLLVSTIMIGIITYVSVIERTKEIGILRSVGARKKDVSRVFNAETLIVGFVAGTIGVGISYLLIIPINLIIARLAEIENLANLTLPNAIFLIIGSMVLTLIAGLIPSRMAAKKDPVEALRTE